MSRKFSKGCVIRGIVDFVDFVDIFRDFVGIVFKFDDSWEIVFIIFKDIDEFFIFVNGIGCSWVVKIE